MCLGHYTDRELVDARFNWRTNTDQLNAIRELERRGYTVFNEDGTPRSEDNLLGQVGLRRFRSEGGALCRL